MSCKFSILAFLGWRCEWDAVCLGLKEVQLQHHQPCSVGLKVWTIHQECLYQGVLLVAIQKLKD